MAFKNAFYCDGHKAKVALSRVSWFCSKVSVLSRLADAGGGGSADHLAGHGGITKVDNVYVCLACGYRSTDSSNARCHFKLRHAPQQEASCHICHKTFKNAFYRDRHRAKTHGITKRMLRDSKGPVNFPEVHILPQ